MIELGALQSYDLRRIWPDEARNFTVWLGKNLGQLGSALNMSLEFREREKAVGPFSLDLLAHDVFRDRQVIIENQLEQTDHDHLGKLITYGSVLEAGALVWIARSFRDEHRYAIDWLNNHTDSNVDFFAVALEALQIDDSKPAVNFKVVAFPNNWQKSFAGNRSDPLTDPRSIYLYKFSQTILEELQRIGRFTSLPAPAARHEVTIKNREGIRYEYAFSWSVLRVGVWINSASKAVNSKVFEQLRAQARALEAILNTNLRWDYDAARHGQIISADHGDIDRNDLSKIPQIANWAATMLVKVYDAMEPHIQGALETVRRAIESEATSDLGESPNAD